MRRRVIFRWQILITGFMQKVGRPTGMGKLWLAMRPLSAPETSVQIFPWNADWEDVADFIRMMSQPRPTINIDAYSWGVGNGFLKLSGALGRRGLEVTHANLCDGVYHPSLKTFAWLALTPWPKIKVPPNVRRVTWFRQFQDKPRGHDVVAVDARRTRIDKPFVLELIHADMDESAAFQLEARRVAGLVA